MSGTSISTPRLPRKQPGQAGQFPLFPGRRRGPEARSRRVASPSFSLSPPVPAAPSPAAALGTTPIRGTTAGQRRGDARNGRWQLRDTMAADPRTPKRVAECGWFARNGLVEIRSVGGCVYPAQLIVCARAWQCPVCSAKIRARKAAEMENMITLHGQVGGGITFATFTSGEHRLADPLESSLGVLRRAWDGLLHCGRPYKELKERHGFMGLVLAYEFTYGAEFGHHPHLHALWMHREPLDARGLYEVDAFMRDRWATGIGSAGRYLNPRHGIDLKMNADGPGLGGYISKVQEGDWGPAQELTKGDLKTARKIGGRTPFMIVRDHYADGDMADWDLWQEFNAAVLLGGNRSIPVCRMTPGLRKAILGDGTAPALADEQLAAVEVGGELIAVMTWQTWTRVRREGLGAAVMAAGEAGGLDGINTLLAGHGFGLDRAMPPIERT